jgi:hypothetical protein
MRLNIMTDEVEAMVECRRRAVEGGCKQSVILPIPEESDGGETFAFKF